MKNNFHRQSNLIVSNTNDDELDSYVVSFPLFLKDAQIKGNSLALIFCSAPNLAL